jgi:PAS domain S-box-containing protein
MPHWPLPLDDARRRDAASGLHHDGGLAARSRGLPGDLLLGSPTRWQPSLRTAVRTVLRMRTPAQLWWGAESICLCNDAWAGLFRVPSDRAVLPAAASPASDPWHRLRGEIDQVLADGKARRTGCLRQVVAGRDGAGGARARYLSFVLEAVGDPAGPDGRVPGVMALCLDDTAEVLARRRMAVREALAAALCGAASPDEVAARAAASLAGATDDLAGVAVYLPDGTGRHLVRAAETLPARTRPPESPDAGARPSASAPGSWPLPERLPCAQASDDSPWPVARALRAAQAGEAPLRLRLASGSVAQEDGQAPESDADLPFQAAMLPVLSVPAPPSGGGPRPGDCAPELLAVAVVGLQPLADSDAAQSDFLQAIAARLAQALQAARSTEQDHRHAAFLTAIDGARIRFLRQAGEGLRNPLARMLGHVHGLLEDDRAPETGARRGVLSLLQRDLRELSRMSDSLFDATRIRASALEPRCAPTDLAARTRDLVGLFRATLPRGCLRPKVDCPALPQPVYVDADMWQQVVLNLLSNAVKFTERGGIEIRLRAQDGHAVLTVKDTGVGIPESDLRALFDRRSPTGGAGPRRRDGLGLVMVQEFVRVHGGTVAARSALGRGSTFTVRIPLGHAHLPDACIVRPDTDGAPDGAQAPSGAPGAPAPAAQDASGDASPAQSPGSPPDPVGPPQDAPTRRQSILSVESDTDMRRHLARVLQPHWDIRFAADCAQALRQIRRQRPDLVLCATALPRRGGLELLRALRAERIAADGRPHDLPVLMLTADPDEQQRIAAFEAGADDYLVQPIGPRELRARVGRTLALVQLRREATRQAMELASRTDQLRHSEARFRGLAEASPACVWLVDAGGALAYLNPCCLELLGPADDREAATAWPRALHPDDAPAYRRELDAAQREQRRFHARVRLRNARGEWRWMDTHGMPLFGQDNLYMGHVGMSLDVTDAVAAEQALQDADRRKDEFMVTLAHELRNSLAPLHNAVHALMRRPDMLTDKALSLHQVMDRQLDHMDQLVEDLTELSRIARGVVVLHPKEIDLHAALQRALDISRPAVERQHHRLHVDLPGTPLPCLGDELRLAQAFSNLVNNAAKYTPPGGDIRLAAQRLPDALVVTVRDNGIGIAPDMIDRIFGMFVQADRPESPGPGGLGIGLALVRSLVELHGGTVEARSGGLGQGSEFRVRLPCGPTSGHSPAQAPSAVAPPGSRPA